VAEFGPEDAEEIIVCGAHLDTLPLAPGAFDNLTGVVVMTEIGRALSRYQRHFRRRLRLIAYTAEEFGMQGSVAYVRAHACELERVRFVLNMDSLFWSNAEGVAVLWAPEMRQYIDDTLSGLEPKVTVRNHFAMSSDYLPWVLQGVAAALPIDYNDSFPVWSHTGEDTEDKIPTEWVRMNARVYARLLLRLVIDPGPLPSRRKSREEVVAQVEREGVSVSLEWKDFRPEEDYIEEGK
jgi:aminopeptidase YwaD